MYTMNPEALLAYYVQDTREKFSFFCERHASLEAYGCWITNTFAYVQHTVPVTRVVAENCVDDALRTLLERRADEELGHDQQLLIDLDSLGFKDVKFPVAPPIQTLASLSKNIPYSLDQLSLLVGHMQVLELLHPSREDLKCVAANFGVSSSSMSTFSAHADVDLVHSESTSRLADHPLVSKRIATSAAIRVLQLLRDYWIWMQNEENWQIPMESRTLKRVATQ